MCENFLRFRPFGPELWGKRGFLVGLSHFFYVEANVIIPYMGTFFQAMVLKLCTGYLSPYYGVCVKIFCDFVHFGPELWGKRVF